MSTKKSNAYKVSEDVAEQTVAEMEEEFGALDGESRALVLDATQRGLITWDDAEGSLTYTLQKPIEQAEDQPVTSLTFTEPNVEQIEKINKGIQVKTNSQGETVMTAAMQTQQVKRIVSVLSGIPEGLANRMKRRDYAVVEALTGFFG
jgi:hypothetical protein